MNTEVGAGTLNPATFLRVLGPEPWRVAYVEPSVRPDDSRYGENPNRIQTHTQFQVIFKPEPGDAQELYLGSLTALGVDVSRHDVRFVEDNWASPALGAWGLGWEVWLDGLEITQFTYFQQAGGVSLDPPSVEITYGMERIMMALQGVTHFKDIEYAPGVRYGEVFGTAEYQMSRYYLDEADVAAQRELLDLYAAEAQRMVDAGLAVPAHTYVLKCSQAFNVLDSRGAVSTAERAAEFARMRRLAGEVARLWEAERERAGYPLGIAEKPQPGRAAIDSPHVADDAARQLVFEIGTEEMPPAEARLARDHVTRLLTERLAATRLAHGAVQVDATPRRLVACVTEVAARETDQVRVVRGPKVSSARKPDGSPTPAAAGFAKSQGLDLAELTEVEVNGVRHLAATVHETGRPALDVLAEVLRGVVTGLRSSKNMRWRDPALSFTRPIRWLLALWGDAIVPVNVSTLAAGRETRIQRTAATPVVVVASADDYQTVLRDSGIVLSSTSRREIIESTATSLATNVGGNIDLTAESTLITQIVDLVEHPTPLLGTFADRYLQLPEAVLTTVMRKHQRYLPVRDQQGALLAHFIAIANGDIDIDLVRAGNEAVLRARYEDAAFFYTADKDTSIDTMRSRLTQLTFTDRLGSIADRVERIAALSTTLANNVELDTDEQSVLNRAAGLIKFDLGSQLVTEMTSLAGIMARDYALHAGEPETVATAIFETELPRNTTDELPVSLPGALLSLADRLDLMTGLAATIGLPTGSSDPFAIRRAALGLIAVHRSQPRLANLSLSAGIAAAATLLPIPIPPGILEDVQEFLTHRLEQTLTEEGHPIDHIRATLLHADRPHTVDQLLAQLDRLANEKSFQTLTDTIQRVRRILPPDTPATYHTDILTEPAELRLHQTLKHLTTQPTGQPDLDQFVAATTKLIEPIDTFFDHVLVMAEDPQLRQTRLGLLATISTLADHILDWTQLRL